MEEVKIIYCYDEEAKPIHYTKVLKGNKYFCIDCGAELICKEGIKKIKHLAHKNTDNCGGTGESIFHKHWKENLFKAGMYINIANKFSIPNNVEILDVLNEVSLNKRYNKNWDIEIIVDTLLITEKGDVVIEINFTNPKDWIKLKPYYDELKLLRVYEVTVSKNINDKLKWFCLNENEELEKIKKQRQLEFNKISSDNYDKRKEKEHIKQEKKQERAKLKKEKIIEQKYIEKENLKNGTTKLHKIYLNFKINPIKESNNLYTLTTLYEYDKNQYRKINLKFNLNSIKTKETKFISDFKITNGIKHCWVLINNVLIDNKYYEVLKYNSINDELYNKVLYAQLCNIY